MREPLKPTFVNERARLEEHDRTMANAVRVHRTTRICPDCYQPVSSCVHRPAPGTGRGIPNDHGINLG